MASMDAVNSKFAWARNHFELVNAEVSAYMQVNPCKFVPNPNITVDAHGQKWAYGKFVATIPIPERIPQILGDCIGNLRYCLDYLVWELVGANGEQPTRNNAFPICLSPNAFKGALKCKRLDGVCAAASTIIEKIQPYQRGNDASKSLLSVLDEFTNINKHRRVLLTTIRTSHPTSDMQVIDGQPFALVNPPKTQVDAEFGPFKVIGDRVEVNAEVMAYLVFDEAPAKGFEIISMIEAIADYINQGVLPQFDQFF
jgi:hypothetical protein